MLAFVGAVFKRPPERAPLNSQLLNPSQKVRGNAGRPLELPECNAKLVVKPVPGAIRFPQRLECPEHGWLKETVKPIRMRFHKDAPNWCVMDGCKARALRNATTESQNESTSLHVARRIANPRNFDLINS